jgi:8-oxo-dGTP pyrophosphatase MutT (NUDIX family)
MCCACFSLFSCAFAGTAMDSSDRKTQLLTASRRGAARELFEETGINVQSQLDRMKPAFLRNTDDETVLENEYKHRLFFVLNVNDDDFAETGTAPMGKDGAHLKVCCVIIPPKWNLRHVTCNFPENPWI